MRSATCESACWISRGCSRSTSDFWSCASLRGLPNQVACQKRKGIRTKRNVIARMTKSQRRFRPGLGAAMVWSVTSVSSLRDYSDISLQGLKAPKREQIHVAAKAATHEAQNPQFAKWARLWIRCAHHKKPRPTKLNI